MKDSLIIKTLVSLRTFHRSSPFLIFWNVVHVTLLLCAGCSTKNTCIHQKHIKWEMHWTNAAGWRNDTTESKWWGLVMETACTTHRTWTVASITVAPDSEIKPQTHVTRVTCTTLRYDPSSYMKKTVWYLTKLCIINHDTFQLYSIADKMHLFINILYFFTADECTSYNSTVTCEKMWVNELLHEHEHERYGLLLKQCRTTYNTSHFIYTYTLQCENIHNRLHKNYYNKNKE
jgi:hypothetical protein